MINIVLADDHKLVRTGIKELLEKVHDFTVVAEACSGEQAVQVAREHQPDVVLLDIEMPGISGLEATRRILRTVKGVRVIGISERCDGPYPMHLFDAGAVGYLSKDGESRELESAVRSVMFGQRYMNGEVARNLFIQRVDGEGTPIDDLSRRELEVLLHVSRADNLQTIAQALNISPKTVSTYRTRLCRKLGVTSDVQLAHVALRYGLLNPAAL